MTSSTQRGFWAVAVQLDGPEWNATHARQLVDELRRAWLQLSSRVGVVAPFEIRLAEHPDSTGNYSIVSHLIRNASSPSVANAAVNAVLAPAIEKVNPGATSRSFVAKFE